MKLDSGGVAGNRKLGAHELQEYWSNLSGRFLPRDPEGLAVICYAGMPHWFNGFLDRYQRMALSRLTRGLDFRGLRVLDIGTGIGRWARWFAERGAGSVIGIDIDDGRLADARVRGNALNIDYRRMAVGNLAFRSESFDVVNSVTVLQHVDRVVKEQALAEISRVLRPNGRVILFELTDTRDDAVHVFPESRRAWENMCRVEGLHVIRATGDQYTPLIRLGKALFNRDRIDEFKAAGPDGQGLRPSAIGLRALVLLSYPVEEICQRFGPTSAAKITGFLLQKEPRRNGGAERGEAAS